MQMNVCGVCFSYNSHPVLEDIDFEVDRGEILAVMGPNGVGKTTLLKCMNDILTPGRGSVYVLREDVRRLEGSDIARKMGYVPQKAEIGRITVFDAILMGRKPHIRWKISEHDLKVVDAAVKKLGMQEMSLRYLDQLSGGEVQKVNIARALVQEPAVLLLDEPTSSLDLKNQQEILKLVRQVVREHSVAAVLTMHSLNTALRFADKFLFIKQGRIFAGTDRSGVTPEIISQVYGVPVDIHYLQGNPVVVPTN
ncbi:MAG: ABC transporter ATP-binding protein [Desulfonatronovibrionaceae bacterium]